MSEEEFDFDEDMEIDPDALDVEWLGQASLHQRYSERLAKANRKARRLHERVKVIRSELILEANRDGIEGIDKISDIKVEAYYRDHKRHKEAKEELIQAEFEADLLQGVVFSLNQRKKALEKLVELHGQQYFASPQLPRNLSEEWGRKMKEGGQRKRFEGQADKMKTTPKDKPTPKRTRRTKNGK